MNNNVEVNTENATLVTSTKQKEKLMTGFFEHLREISSFISSEDLNVALEALKTTEYRVKEREKRVQEEKDAEIARQKWEEECKRKELAARRAERRRQRLHAKHVEEVTAMDLPLDFVNSFESDERVAGQSMSCADGLLYSLDTLGLVDIEFISTVSGKELKEVIQELKGSIYQNPIHWKECFYKGWETADEYLSGNLMQKYAIAKEANEEYNGYFAENLKALEGVIEPDIAPEDIYVTLGSPWVPSKIIDDFIIHLLGETPTNVEMYYGAEYAVRHDEITGIWEIPQRNRFRAKELHGKYEEANYTIWGTRRMDMLYLMENILNMKTLTISDSKDPKGKIRLLNKEETIKILEKQDKMINEFKSWVWQDNERKSLLQKAYCSKYGNIKKRVFDGSFLEFPNMSEEYSLYPFQKDSVARILMSQNTLLAHDVGSGKTFVMIAAGMELRRLGKSKKNLYVVPNNIIMQWESLFEKMYPEAKILTVTNKNFNAKKRLDTLKQIMYEDFDAILMTYSCFDMLSLSKKYYINLYEERLKILEKASKRFYSTGKTSRRISATKQALEELKKNKGLDTALIKVEESYVNNICEVAFDELGINTLFVDEAHNYKNVEVETSISRVLGAGGRGSRKCCAMMDKVHCVQRQNNGGRVIFATGTPITNSITDIFVMQKYLQDGELEFMGLHNFDNWVAMFAEKNTDFEIDVDTSSYHLVTRFSRFSNIPELSSILSSIADFHHTKNAENDEIPDFAGYTDSLREGTDNFKEYLTDISNRADDVRQKRVSRFEDNLLKITSDGRKAALDMRLIDSVYGLEPESKVMRCAENIMDVYSKTRKMKGVQLVFCDSSTPKEGFNLYDELRTLLCAMGLKKEQVVFVHDATDDADREKLFEKLRTGEVAVMVGSTFKMGIGVNVQERLTALHHLDVPWRPADMVQREGRILRNGNLNKLVMIYRYITKGSFDAYSWQMLEMKQRFISQILSGYTTTRSGSDVDEAVLNYAEVKALAVGNPLIKKRVEVANELSKYMILQQDYVEERKQKQAELAKLPDDIEWIEEKIEKCKQDIQTASKIQINVQDKSAEEQELRRDIRRRIYNAVKTHQDMPYEYEVLTYLGFKVVIPAYMKPREKTIGKDESKRTEWIPYFCLRGNGTYHVEMESESGITRRIFNFLLPYEMRKKENESKGKKYIISEEADKMSGLEKVLENYTNRLEYLRLREETLTKELSSVGGYQAEIAKFRTELDHIDEELGVKVA